MKNLLFLLIFLPSFLFAQIPNSGFENWSTPDTVEIPDGWNVNIWEPGTIEKTTENVSGNFAIYMANGQAFNEVSAYTNFQPNADFNKLKGFIRVDSTSVFGGGHLQINAWAGGSYSFIGSFDQIEPTIGFIPFEILLELPSEPIDSIRITLRAGPTPIPNGIALGLSEIFFDDLQLVLEDSTTSIANIEQSNYIELYPNPAVDAFNIKFDINGQKQVTVFDISGKPVLERTTNDRSFECSIGHLPTGTYLVLVRTEEGKTYRQKLIKIESTN